MAGQVVDAAAEQEDGKHRPGGEAGGGAVHVFQFALLIFLHACFVQGEHGALGVNGGADAIERLFVLKRGRTPKGHDAITDVFIEGAVVFFDLIGDEGEVGVDGVQGFAGLFVVKSFGLFLGEFVLGDIGGGVILAFVGELSEAADIGEEGGDS